MPHDVNLPSGPPAISEDGGPTPPRTVVVGISDKDNGLDGVSRAAAWAERGGATLDIVHAFVWPLYEVDLEPVAGIRNSGLRFSAEKLLRDAWEIAQRTAPDVPVRLRLITGRINDVLVAASVGADLMVIAGRGMGRILGRLAGSSSLFLMTHAESPLLVMRGENRPEGAIIVAVDGSREAEIAIVEAARVAESLGAGLSIACPLAGLPGRGAAEEILEGARAIAVDVVPGLEVTTTIAEGRSKAAAVCDVAAEARLLVIGPRLKESHVKGSLSETSVAILQHVATPVFLARKTTRGEA